MIEATQIVPSLRETLAAATRSQIVEAATQLFLEHGYVGTSIGAIARRAGVAVQTIYNAVGNKAAVLSAVLDTAASGPNAPTPVPVFMAERTRETIDVAALVSMLADWFVEVNERTASIHWIIQQAAAVDEDAAELNRARSRQRLINYGHAAAALRERGGLATGSTDQQAAATIWALGHPTAYRTFVLDEGWSVDDYRNWLGIALASALG
ncbi:putative transcriptional regulator [marine actinobacterium PHSC20C1]|nr:putative transcriptional regulator [marine actinobacterium PHSC20C1]